MLKITNNASGVLGASLNSASTSVSLAGGAGSKFPTISSPGEWFPVTVVSASDPSLIEVMRCTARAGDVLTVKRGQEGTTAREFLPGDVVGLRVTAGAYEEAFPQVVETDEGSKKLRLDLSEVTDGQVRRVLLPDRDVDLKRLPIELGGTGAVSAQEARENLSLKALALLDVANIEHGGTGAQDAQTARNNLGLGNNNAGRSNLGMGSNDNVQFAQVTCSILNATSSDRRLKTDIALVDPETVFKLRGVGFTLKKTKDRLSGVIAQQIERWAPELVRTGEDGKKSVVYDGLIAYVIEGMKLMRKEAKALQAENKKLAKRIEKLERLIAKAGL